VAARNGHARAVLIDKNPKVVAFEILERCRHFAAWGVKTILVFDGMRQPLKHRTNEERARRRIKCQIEVERLLVSDDVEIDDSLLRSAVAVNEEMVLMVIDHLSANGWSHYVRAPYEADGQLAFMAREGEIDYVQTIDSDLLAHGCPRVLMRMSPGGWCDLYDRASLWLLLCSEFSEGDDGNRRTLVRQRPWSSFGSRVA
jgi:exonuclease-1